VHVFVYGTLQRGQRNHRRYCGGLIEACSAALPGRLYLLPQGYPMLEVAAPERLPRGTGDPLADAARSGRPAAAPEPAAEGDWDWVAGELLTLADPARALPALDALEGFDPLAADRRNLYLRVLVACRAEPCRLAWTYVAPAGSLPRGAHRIGPSWPPDDTAPAG
jgi:gamma-glutamylcyclotransferase (GGCT)/AIG2-like uncharacterized protein YtfP